MSQPIDNLVEDSKTDTSANVNENGQNGLDIHNSSKESNGESHSEISNGNESGSEKPIRRSKRTRSRSKTPQIKNGIDKPEPELITAANEIIPEETAENGEKENSPEDEDEVQNESLDVKKNSVAEKTDDVKNANDRGEEEHNTSDEFALDSDAFMDPLVLQADEPCPELEFEESSDKESGKFSPIISRCATRRSQNRNIPTPKTPKSMLDEQESEEGSTPDPEEVPKNSLLRDLNETDTSSNAGNLSTKVQVGSDGALNVSDGESDFLSNLRGREGSYPRCISSRRSIRHKDDIRKKSLRNSMHRANLSIPFFSRDSEERAPSLKRKSRSETPEDRKRFKEDSPSLMAKITSPLSILKNKFVGVPNMASTPKLTAYKDQKNHFGGDFFDQMERAEEAVETPNKWCSIM